jgi:Ca-activated chloride channel family protein
MIRFLRPDLLNWVLVVPVIVAGWALRGRYLGAMRRRAAMAPRFASLSRRSTRARSAAGLTIAIAAAAALVVALLRPQAVVTVRTPDYERQDLIVMLDRSISMRAHDIAPSRFSRATLELRNFLRDKPEGIDRVGLVGFADASVILSYLSADADSLAFYLDWIDADPTVYFGTNIGAALQSAREVAAKDHRRTKKLFVVVSDGEDYGGELERALAQFRAAGARIHCIGIGSEGRVPIPIRQEDGREAWLRDESGAVVKTTFDESTLRRIALTTGGRYFRSTRGDDLARGLADVVAGERTIAGWRTSAQYRDLYPAALGAAALAVAALWLLL